MRWGSVLPWCSLVISLILLFCRGRLCLLLYETLIDLRHSSLHLQGSVVPCDDSWLSDGRPWSRNHRWTLCEQVFELCLSLEFQSQSFHLSSPNDALSSQGHYSKLSYEEDTLTLTVLWRFLHRRHRYPDHKALKNVSHFIPGYISHVAQEGIGSHFLHHQVHPLSSYRTALMYEQTFSLSIYRREGLELEVMLL